MAEMTIALLGQPNSGKSTLFNALTGARQHVGNWPGKTVERCVGSFKRNGKEYTVVDLPGTYSLSANSDEEIVTRDYIASGEADMVCILADASQLSRSLFMLADYAGTKVPAILLLNMMDVAESQGRSIDVKAIEEKLGIPVIPFVASDTKNYDAFYQAIEKGGKVIKSDELARLCDETLGETYEKVKELLPAGGVSVYEPSWVISKLIERDPLAREMVSNTLDEKTAKEIDLAITNGGLGASDTGNAKFRWVDELLSGSVEEAPSKGATLGKFDRLATSKRWGKWVAAGLILVGLIMSIVVGMPFMLIGSAIPMICNPLSELLAGWGVHPLLNSILSQALVTGIAFSFMMSGYIFGASLVFGFFEEVGYMARISYVFDGTMKKLGLHGKAVMPFLVSFGCNIAGGAASRTLDTWGQRMTAIAMSWVVPCASTWGVVGLVGFVFFGPGAALIIFLLFLVSVLHLQLTARVFGKRFLANSDRTGLIMELPPYHKARWGSLLKMSLLRMKDAFKRAVVIISLVAIIFCLLSYSREGTMEQSIIYKIGTAIEPVTMFFGLRWQTFTAWIASGLGKEAALGVLAAVFSNNTVMNAIANMTMATNDNAAIGASLLSTISKPEALAFIFAFYFNMPCLMTLSATINETHSAKWMIRVALYYIGVSLLLACIVYHLSSLIF